MGLPNTFANQTNPQMQELDQNFQAVGIMGTFAGTIAGTNNLVLTLAANQPDLAAYSNYLIFSGIAVATSTGAVNLQVGSLASLPVYKDTTTGVVAAGANDIVIATHLTFTYDSALNSGNGGFHIGGGGAGGLQRSGAVTANHLAVWNDSNSLKDGGAPPTPPSYHCTVVTGTGSFVLPAGFTNTTPLKISQAAGGGGGGGCLNGGGSAVAGGGGAAGATGVGVFIGFVGGQTISVTIGAAGAGGANTGADGGAGGASSMSYAAGTFISCTAGSGGIGCTATGPVSPGGSGGATFTNAGGITCSATITLFGITPATPGFSVTGAVLGGMGGSSILGGASNSTRVGGAGNLFGGGGGGAASSSGSGTAGAAGAAGGAIFEYVL